jgi:hypothetical protein
MDGLKHKTVSIHLQEDAELGGLSAELQNQMVNIVKVLLQSFKVYLVVCRKVQERNPIIEVLRRAGVSEVGFESNEGAVAVLRQLSCGTHLEGNLGLYRTLVQYLPVVWLTDSSKQEAQIQFRNEVEMVMSLEVLIKKTKDIKEE